MVKILADRKFLPLAAGRLLIFGKFSKGGGAEKFLVYREGRSFRRATKSRIGAEDFDKKSARV